MERLDPTLLAMVLEDRADPHRLKVLADALSELGDPRGELVLEQLQAAELRHPRAQKAGKRADELLQIHHDRFFGRFDEWLSTTWRSGFVSSAWTRTWHPQTSLPTTKMEDGLRLLLEHPSGALVESFRGEARQAVCLETVPSALRQVVLEGRGPSVPKLLRTQPWLRELVAELLPEDAVEGLGHPKLESVTLSVPGVNDVPEVSSWAFPKVSALGLGRVAAGPAPRSSGRTGVPPGPQPTLGALQGLLAWVAERRVRALALSGFHLTPVHWRVLAESPAAPMLETLTVTTQIDRELVAAVLQHAAALGDVRGIHLRATNPVTPDLGRHLASLGRRVSLSSA